MKLSAVWTKSEPLASWPPENPHAPTGFKYVFRMMALRPPVAKNPLLPFVGRELFVGPLLMDNFQKEENRL